MLRTLCVNGGDLGIKFCAVDTCCSCSKKMQRFISLFLSFVVGSFMTTELLIWNSYNLLWTSEGVDWKCQGKGALLWTRPFERAGLFIQLSFDLLHMKALSVERERAWSSMVPEAI